MGRYESAAHYAESAAGCHELKTSYDMTATDGDELSPVV